MMQVVAIVAMMSMQWVTGFRLLVNANRVRNPTFPDSFNGSFFDGSGSFSNSGEILVNSGSSLENGHVHELSKDFVGSHNSFGSMDEFTGDLSDMNLGSKGKSQQQLALMNSGSGRLEDSSSHNQLALMNSGSGRLESSSHNQLALKNSGSGRLDSSQHNQLALVNSGSGRLNNSRQLALIPLNDVRTSGSDVLNSADLLTMGSMVSSSFEDSFHEVAVVKSNSKILEFDAGSGQIVLQNQLTPTAEVKKMHLIATDIKFRPGGMGAGMKATNNNKELAKKYGEELARPEQVAGLAEEIQALQADQAPGSKYIFCIALGTSAKEGELETQGRPEFAQNRAENVKKHLQEAMEELGVEGEIKEPQVQYRKDRVAAILMKIYTGTEPPCTSSEITIGAIKRRGK